MWESMGLSELKQKGRKRERERDEKRYFDREIDTKDLHPSTSV
jgi:hypothetical protein